MLPPRLGASSGPLTAFVARELKTRGGASFETVVAPAAAPAPSLSQNTTSGPCSAVQPHRDRDSETERQIHCADLSEILAGCPSESFCRPRRPSGAIKRRDFRRPELSPSEVQDLVLAVIEHGLRRKEAEVGIHLRGVDGLADVWTGPVEGIIARIRREWDALDRDPHPGEVAMLERPR